VLGMGFEAEGFCVVKGPDVLWGGDVRRFHPPTGVFDGVIGGDPCQAHSKLANLVRAKGLEPSFPDLTGEYQRVVEEARPRWFLRENVPGAPDVKPAGYDVRSFLLDHSTMDSGDGTGHEQRRRRRFWFGVRDGPAPELRRWIAFALEVLPDAALKVNAAHDHLDGAEKITRRRGHRTQPMNTQGNLTPGERHRRQGVTADPRAVPVAVGGSGKRKQTATARHTGAIRSHGGENAPRYSLAEMLDLQQLPADLFEHSPFTVQAKRKLVGNAVPYGMAKALARAVRLAMEKT